jgi:hypothetical protein
MQRMLFAVADGAHDLMRPPRHAQAGLTAIGLGGGVTLLSTTATLQYNVWEGLFVHGEYRHDSADTAVFSCRPEQACQNKSQDTLSVSFYDKLF